MALIDRIAALPTGPRGAARKPPEPRMPAPRRDPDRSRGSAGAALSLGRNCYDGEAAAPAGHAGPKHRSHRSQVELIVRKGRRDRGTAESASTIEIDGLGDRAPPRARSAAVLRRWRTRKRLLDQFNELRARCQQQAGSIFTPMGDETYYRYQEALIADAAATIAVLLRRASGPQPLAVIVAQLLRYRDALVADPAGARRRTSPGLRAPSPRAEEHRLPLDRREVAAAI